MGHAATLRFPSPLIEPDVPISGIRLSDWLHREAHGEKFGPQASSARRLPLLRLAIQLSLKGPDHSRCLQAYRQSPSPRHLRKHTRSQGPFLRRGYRLHRSYDPVRLPSVPPPKATLRPLPSHQTGLPDYSNHLSDVPRPLPRRIKRVLMSISFRSRGLPQMAGGSASALSLSRTCSGFTRVTAHRIAQPPTGDLCHEAPTRAVTRTSRSSATGSIDNSPGGFFLH